jgi:UPF0271 protein
MLKFDLNADLGEGITLNGQSADAFILPFINSANIACGYHAGDDNTMRDTVALCKAHHVRIGAHPSYADRANFGRIETGETPEQIYTHTYSQVAKLQTLCQQQHVELTHIKPHGALYHRLITDRAAVEAFLRAIDEVAPAAKIVGFPGSVLLELAGPERAMREAFVDRAYTADGRLRPRSEAGAVIDDPHAAAQQALQFVVERRADTLCIHGDSPHALTIARITHEFLTQHAVD